MSGTGSVRRVVMGAAASALALAPLLATSTGGAQTTAEWNIAMVGGPAGGSGMTIAIVDSGVDLDHFAFGGPGNDRVLPGIDLVDDDADPNDLHGHGTHVAGIAAGGGIDCNGPTAIGMAPEAKILPVRVLDAVGDGSMADVIAGIDYAVAKGADVINLSLGEAPSLLGLGGDSGPFLAALTRAWNAGSIPVLAAGNNGGLLDSILFPSGYGAVDAVVVTAVTQQNVRAGYAVSASTARWGIGAPGGDASRQILSSIDRQQCGLMSGTSMAAPHVSGALAILMSRGLSPQAAVDRMLSTAASSGSGTGAGLLDLDAALVGLADSAPSSTTATPTTTSAETPTTTTATTTAPAISPTTAPAEPSTSASTSTEVPDEVAEDETPAMPLADGAPPEEAVEVTIESGADSIPGGAAVAAAAAVTLTWLAWLGVLRRRFV